MRIGKGERRVQKRPFHATQLSGSHQNARGKLGLFQRQPNEASRHGGPFRRQYPLTNAICDDFPGPRVETSHSYSKKKKSFNIDSIGFLVLIGGHETVLVKYT